MTIRKCKTCRFFNTDDAGGISHCRRFPPTVIDGNSSAFPVVPTFFSCGEHHFSWLRLFGIKRIPKGVK
jgi:hypothetical protein